MSNTKLQYRVTPPSAFIKTTVEQLTIIVSNGSSANIVFTANDQLTITIPADLVSGYGFSFSTSTGSGFAVNKGNKAGIYLVTVPFNDVTLKPGDSFQVIFSQVPVGDTADSYNINVSELLGGDTNVDSLPFTLQSVGLGVIAWLDKLIVGETEATNLNWTTTGGSQVIISGFPTGSGQQQVGLSGNIPVYVPQRGDTSQWTYTVTVYSGQNSKGALVVLQKNPPVINSFDSSPDSASPIAVDQAVTLSWHTQFASSVILTTPTLPNARQRIPANPLQVTPGLDLVKTYQYSWSQLPPTAEYILTANGFSEAAVKTVNIAFKPIQLVYFKYSAKSGGNPMFKVDPETWQAVAFEQGSANLATFTVYQPGGSKTVYYLGDGDQTHPQIRYFAATEDKGAYDLEWVTANCQSLVLNPGNIPITGGDITSGTKTGLAPGTYTLTGTAANGATVNSVLQVGDSQQSSPEAWLTEEH